MDSAEDASVRVEVAVAHAAGEVACIRLHLRSGSTVADALRAAGVLDRFGAAAIDAMTTGIWGRACGPDALLADGDRVELTRALRVDPKEARRLRYRRDGLRKLRASDRPR